MAINKFAKKRGIHATDITDHETPPFEDTTHEEQTDPHQFDDALTNEIDPILDYINSQHHQEEDMNHALQAYNVMASPTPDDTPQQSINLIHIHLLYHVAKAKQVQHGSLADRGANGGLEGSDVRILSKSSRKCTVTAIDQCQINGLDIMQCAAAYYGKYHTIHSANQIEWHKNLVDGKSVKVGGKQCITTRWLCISHEVYRRLLVQRCYRFLCTYPEVLICIGLVLVEHGNENPFRHVLVCDFCI